MDGSFSNHEMLMQQLQQLKRELAMKERKLMKMERVAQARKRALKLNPERKLPSLNEGANDDSKQNDSASCVSISSSTNDLFCDTSLLNIRKCDMYCNKDIHDNVSKKSGSNSHEYQKEYASVLSEHLCKSSEMLPCISARTNESKDTLSSVSSSGPKECIVGDTTIVSMYGNDLTLYGDSSAKMNKSEQAIKKELVSDEYGIKNTSFAESCVGTQPDLPSEIFVSDEAPKCVSSSVGLLFNTQNPNKAKKSPSLKVGTSFDDCIITQQIKFEKESICIREKLPRGSKKTVKIKPEQNDPTTSAHSVKPEPHNTDTDQSDCQENRSRFAGVLRKRKETGLRRSFSKETISTEYFNDKADTNNHNFKASSTEVFSSSRSFRRSQRLAKQNSAISYDEKHTATNGRTSVIGKLFEWLSQKCESHDIIHFELPPEEFGLLMEIKVKNSNQNAWPPSPSESFEILTPEDFVPDSEEDKNPYCHDSKRLFSSLTVVDPTCSIEGSPGASEHFSNSLKMLAHERSPSKPSREGNEDHASVSNLKREELHQRSEDSVINVTKDLDEFILCTPNKLSSFQESPVKSVIFDNFESQSPLKSKQFELHVVLETEDFDLDLTDVEKAPKDQSVCCNSPTVSKCLDTGVTFGATSDIKMFNSGNVLHTTPCNHNTSPQECDMDEGTEQLNISFTNSSELGFNSVKKPADKIMDISNSEVKGRQSKLFTDNDNFTTDAFPPGRMLNTTTDELTLDVKKCYLQLQNNVLPKDKALNESTEVNQNLSFLCCLENENLTTELTSIYMESCTENKEPIKRIHVISVSNEVLIVIQCISVIEIWKKILPKEWTKLGVYHVENMTSIEKSCVLSSGKYIIFVLLVYTNGRQNLKFLSIGENLELIQIMENSNFKQNSNRMRTKLILCGLEGLTFATAEGTKCYSVDVHFVEAASSQPFLTSWKLGSVSDSLLGLSSVCNAPKAVMGWSMECIYIWNYISGSLVATVNLVPKPMNLYDKCLWATSEEGLLFLLMTSGDENSMDSCHLLAVNPVTGFWDTIQYFQHSSHEEHKTTNEFIDGTVMGRLVVLSCCQNSYVWDLFTGFHIASLAKCNVTSVMCGHEILAVGLLSGCVNLYSFLGDSICT